VWVFVHVLVSVGVETKQNEQARPGRARPRREVKGRNNVTAHNGVKNFVIVVADTYNTDDPPH
jgi:hypothetical protein